MSIERNPYRIRGDSDDEMSNLSMKTAEPRNENSLQSREYQAFTANGYYVNNAGYLSNPMAKRRKTTTSDENTITLPPLPTTHCPRPSFAVSGNVLIGASERVEGAKGIPLFEPPNNVNWKFDGTYTWNTKGLELSVNERRAYEVGYTDEYATGYREGVGFVIRGGVSGLGGETPAVGENKEPFGGLPGGHGRRNAFSGPSGGGLGVAGAVSRTCPEQFAQEMDEITRKGRKHD